MYKTGEGWGKGGGGGRLIGFAEQVKNKLPAVGMRPRRSIDSEVRGVPSGRGNSFAKTTTSEKGPPTDTNARYH